MRILILPRGINAGSSSRIAAGNRAYILTRKQSTPMSPAWKRLGDGVGLMWKTLPTPGKIPASPQDSSPLRSWPPFLCLCSPKNKQTSKLSRTSLTPGSSSSPRSKYKHRRTLTFEIKKKTTQERGQVTHILCKVSCFLLKSFHFRRLRKR